MIFQDSVHVEIISVIFVVDNSLMMNLILSNTQNVAKNVIQGNKFGNNSYQPSRKNTWQECIESNFPS
jgi:hypothetical protein